MSAQPKTILDAPDWARFARCSADSGFDWFDADVGEWMEAVNVERPRAYEEVGAVTMRALIAAKRHVELATRESA